MIKHIVLWKFREGTQAQAAEFLRKLAQLQGQIPEIAAMQVQRSRKRTVRRRSHCVLFGYGRPCALPK
jgi:hypothetical protein